MDNLTIIASKKNWIDTRSVETLKNITQFKGVKKVVGLPDLSIGFVPNGSAILTEDRIYPHLIGGDIGCGMSLFEVPLKAKKIKVSKFVKALSKIESLDDIDIDEPSLGYHLGTIGKGNHFAELHLVNEIKDYMLFKQLSLDENSLYTLVHSGSRAFGQIIFDKVAGQYNPNEGLSITQASSYLKEHDKAIIYAKKSRQQIAKRLLKAIKLESNLKYVSDTAHNSIEKTKDGLLHRKGATPTNKGAVIIAGSRGTLSYLVMPTDDTKKSNYSLAHGAGRKWERSSAEEKLKNHYTKDSLERTSIGSRVLCKDKKLLYEEAPQVYKNIDVVINDLVDAGLATVIATFKPILTYKE
ncbi:MAG: RNA ligase RtcB family protein [Arcobacter sp.]|nr:MAG: RNA ligase RtcB family protein [Arcobacter sp.]